MEYRGRTLFKPFDVLNNMRYKWGNSSDRALNVCFSDIYKIIYTLYVRVGPLFVCMLCDGLGGGVEKTVVLLHIIMTSVYIQC